MEKGVFFEVEMFFTSRGMMGMVGWMVFQGNWAYVSSAKERSKCGKRDRGSAHSSIGNFFFRGGKLAVTEKVGRLWVG